LACPYFMPDQRLEADWLFPHRLPLGAGWSGICTASPQAPRPLEGELKSACNLGYATNCPRLPAERHADAVRFAMGEEADGLLRVRYAMERAHAPAGHGELVYIVASGEWQTRHGNACVQRMAECYVEVQMTRRSNCIAGEPAYDQQEHSTQEEGNGD
jgi:hypothetical protein